MNDFLYGVAWASMVLSITSAVLAPLLIGRDKTGKWGYGDFVYKTIGAILTPLLCMRVLGWI